MLAQLRKSLLLLSFILIVSSAAFAQMTTMEGDVKDANGQPMKGAVINLDRTDIKGHYSVKTDKKGHYFYMGLPFGTYTVSCVIDGKVADKVDGVKTNYSDSTKTDFDLRKQAAQQQQMQQSMQSGQLAPEQEKGMTKEQKEQFEAQAKKASESMKKNKALNDSFNAGMDASKKAQSDTDNAQKVTDYTAAVTSFNQAKDLDPTQVAVWENLGFSNYQLALVQTGDDRNKSLDAALAAYQKAVELKPDQASLYIQEGNIYGAQKKTPEAEQALTKAAQLDPASAGKAYFNMGANLVNSGHPDQASEWFKKATDSNPDNAEAWYQLGSTLAMKGTVDPKTGAQAYPPGTAEAYQKYLQLQPNGPHVQEAQAMLEALGQKVQTKTVVPGAKKK